MQEFNPSSRVKMAPGPMLDPTSSEAEDTGALRVNRLLRSLGSDAAVAMMGASRRVSFRGGQTLWLSGERSETVCFPLNGLVAGLATDVDGAAAQVECTGAEGAVGLVEALGGAPSAFEQRTMVATEAWLVPAEAVRALMQTCPEAAQTLQRHVARLYDEARRASACAARHPLRARLADCLLAYQEKTALTRLPLTQEMLSAVLGANRTTVTALAISLSDAGLTRTGRGWIAIVDGERLDRIACGCHKAIRWGGIRNAPPSLA